MNKKNENILNIQRDFNSHILNKENISIKDYLPYCDEEALARLNIYRNNVMGNFGSVLSSIFEVVEKIVGEDYFKKIIHEYARDYPSVSGNLDEYGNGFPKFIKKKLKDHKLSYLEDISKLELAYHQSYFKKDVTKIFDIEKFQEIPQDEYQDLSFKIHPTCFLLSSKFPIFSIWKNNIEDLRGKIEILNNSQHVIIERVGSASTINKLTEEEFLFLYLTKKGKKLYETYEQISEELNKELDIGSLLNKFISNGTFINFKIPK